ncbi:MAG: MmgE/PrpD family protein, partial [Rhizobiaceae bacterium]|nr:MmgE/PrpD family protein [Rhizobiaceae bacterium]
FAAATQIDNLDAHDGYNPTKGHIGCAVVPALYAFAAQRPDLTGREVLEALVIAYEFAARAGVALHDTVSDYHTSGAWNALGVAAMGCRLLGHDAEVLRHALGIAEYHGPRSQMMREIATPTMLHDGSGMGALVGLMAVDMAARGFQGAPAITVEAEEVAHTWQDLGEDWTIEKNYIKPYPICRWAHAAIDAVHQLQSEHAFKEEAIQQVTVRTFHEAAQLYAGVPDSTSKAQYSLAFAVASMLRHGRIGVEQISENAFADEATANLLARIDVLEDQRHSSRFPAGRWSDVTIDLTDGRTLSSGDVHARGGPEAPMSEAEVKEKFLSLSRQTVAPQRMEQIWAAGKALLAPDTPFAALADLVTQSVELDQT